MGTEVAIKKFKDKGFSVELSILQQVKHPNIVELIGYCEEENCIVLEYISWRYNACKHNGGANSAS